jgi:hypothetical protein
MKSDTEAEADVAVARHAPAAEGRAADPRGVEPRAATKRTVFVIDVLHFFLR